MGNRKSEILETLELWNHGTLELWNSVTQKHLLPHTINLNPLPVNWN